jgi:NADH:ubiquinone oxidoreductase subunit 6 (subunit J)
MVPVSVFAWFFSVICLVSAIYVAFSKDLIRVGIAFFIEFASLGAILLTLNADYLALVVVSVGIMGVILVSSFSAEIMGGLKKAFVKDESKPGQFPARLSGMIIGLSVGGAIGWAFLTAPFLASLKVSEPVRNTPDVTQLGQMMLGDHVAVFELLGVLLLLVVVGTGLLLRRSSNVR